MDDPVALDELGALDRLEIQANRSALVEGFGKLVDGGSGLLLAHVVLFIASSGQVRLGLALRPACSTSESFSQISSI
jgi:hypothetical protein